MEANRQGLMSWHRTLRRYLDLLVQGSVLGFEEKDVGSVNPQQLYTLQQARPRLWTGLTALAQHGLNWDVPDKDLYTVPTDLAALVRSKPLNTPGKTILVTGLEDGLAHELKRDFTQQIGSAELVAGMLATHPVDLAYLLRRADLIGIGQSTRRLVMKVIDTYSSIPEDVDGRVFLQVRNRFLKLRHLYSTRGTLKLLDTQGRGRLGTTVVEDLSPSRIVSTGGKQLGVAG